MADGSTGRGGEQRQLVVVTENINQTTEVDVIDEELGAFLSRVARRFRYIAHRWFATGDRVMLARGVFAAGDDLDAVRAVIHARLPELARLDSQPLPSYDDLRVIEVWA